MIGKIRVGNHLWNVTKATFGASILPIDEADAAWGPGTGGMAWGFEIESERVRIFEGEMISPFVYTQVFIVPVRSWREFEGKSFQWPNHPPDEKNDRDRPSIYMFEHDDISFSQVEFGKRDGTSFQFQLRGRYKYFDNEPDEIQVMCRMDFSLAGATAATEEQAWERVCSHLDSAHLNGKSEPPIDMANGRFSFRFLPVP